MSNIQVYQEWGTLNDETGERYFQCPASGQNIYDWPVDHDSYPDELILRDYAQAEEPIYIKPEFYPIYEEWQSLREDGDALLSDTFIEYLTSKLPQNEDFYILVIKDPENIAGEFESYVYSGKLNR